MSRMLSSYCDKLCRASRLCAYSIFFFDLTRSSFPWKNLPWLFSCSVIQVRKRLAKGSSRCLMCVAAEQRSRIKLSAPMLIPKADPSHEKPTSALVSIVISKSLFWRVPVDRQRFISTVVFQKQPLHVKASQNTSAVTSADTFEKNSSGPLQKNVQQLTFPIGFQALVEDVCEQTQIAELKLKIGDFEMFLKRDIGISSAPSPVYAPLESPITAPPIPSEPMDETVASPTPFMEQVSIEETSSPFVNISAAKTLKLASLEASGHDAYVIVASPSVGTFQRGRTIKGNRLPPSCKEGSVIKEGQIIGFLGQCGTELPIRSDVDGEVLKILYEDGEAVGYGDPLVAVLPSFHAIN